VIELLSILNPPIKDLLNDPRLSSDDLIRKIDERHGIITNQVREWSAKVGEVEALDAMMFAVVHDHLEMTVLNTKLTARMTDLGYKTTILNLRLEKLTKVLMWLTVVLGVLCIPLAIEAILKLWGK